MAGDEGVFPQAEVAKLVYALDLGSSAARRESSSLSFRTILPAALPDGVAVTRLAHPGADF